MFRDFIYLPSGYDVVDENYSQKLLSLPSHSAGSGGTGYVCQVFAAV
jgi:hypothetical protein